LETTIKYEGYLEQEASRAERARRNDRRRIAPQFPFERVPGLSREVVQRLQQIQPATLGQAARIPGMTPAAIAVLGVFLNRLGPPAVRT
jgi:tRNA uridine 5-carboxymethylaminomethyl modification enzyme